MRPKNKAAWDAVSDACDSLVKLAFPDSSELDKYHAAIEFDRETFRAKAVVLKGKRVFLPESD